MFEGLVKGYFQGQFHRKNYICVAFINKLMNDKFFLQKSREFKVKLILRRHKKFHISMQMFSIFYKSFNGGICQNRTLHNLSLFFENSCNTYSNILITCNKNLSILFLLKKWLFFYHYRLIFKAQIFLTKNTYFILFKAKTHTCNILLREMNDHLTQTSDTQMRLLTSTLETKLSEQKWETREEVGNNIWEFNLSKEKKY